MKDLPFLFFAFANSPKGEEGYLPNLDKELRSLLTYFSTLKYERGLVDFDHREQAKTEDFFNIFNQIGPKITILHYSGHAENFSMELDDDKLTVERLTNAISGWNNLKLVFLNGCSTVEMVEMLLNKGVKAVIATTEAIDDNEASDFSTLFYEQFCIKNKTLQVAFRQTMNRLDNYVYDEKTAFVARGSGDRSDFEEALEALPWALYYREEDKSILNWELIHTTSTLDIDVTILAKIEAIKRKIKKEKENIDFLKGDIIDFEGDIAAVDNEDKKERIARRISRAKADLLDAERLLDKFFSELKDIIKNEDKKALTESLKSALFKLNYRPQLKLFEEKILANKINAFIVQGGHKCGQDLLKKRLMERAGLRFEGELHLEVMIDFSANSLTIDNIWKKVKEELKLKEVDVHKPESVIKKLHDEYYAEGRDLVFIFNNIHHFGTKKTFPVIKTFWEHFLASFLPLVKNKVLKNRILLIVIDRDCQFEKIGDKFISNKEIIFKDNLKNTDKISELTHIMPIVHPVFAEQLTDWKSNQDLPIDFGLTAEKLEKIAGIDGNLMLPTIKELCKTTNMENLYELYFSKFAYRKIDNL